MARCRAHGQNPARRGRRCRHLRARACRQGRQHQRDQCTQPPGRREESSNPSCAGPAGSRARLVAYNVHGNPSESSTNRPRPWWNAVCATSSVSGRCSARRPPATPGCARPMGSGPANRHGMPTAARRPAPGAELAGARPRRHAGRVARPTGGSRSAASARIPFTLDWDEFLALPQVEDVSDFHCVTTWSRLDNHWNGVRVPHARRAGGAAPRRAHVLCTGYDLMPGTLIPYTTNLPLARAVEDDVLLVHTWEGQPLPREHGGPCRMITPKLYAWKGAKWIRQIEFLAEDQPGFWEVRGYSNTAEPWFNDRLLVRRRAAPSRSAPSDLRPMLATLARRRRRSLIDAALRLRAEVRRHPRARRRSSRAAARRVRIWSRLGNEKTAQFPEIVAALAALGRDADRPGRARRRDRRARRARRAGRISAAAGPHPRHACRAIARRSRSQPPAEQPAAFIAFDLLRDGDDDLRARR